MIALLALLATCYQLYLQRVHNEKSLRPLGQIDFLDKQRTLRVRLCNNGIGPLIIEKITFLKDEKKYSVISDCLDLNPRSYMHLRTSESTRTVIYPASSLIIFEKTFEVDESEENIDDVRTQLSSLSVVVIGRDIYNNKITIKRDFGWFSEIKS
ncbi:hypothetical protein VB264_21130 [Arcicella aquatica]|uniref:Uncharacterized protein n=1 Tax=Arcicella aquatica TaxID=217141 RepID=A0ABU5QVE3_9BACT|nr:hypothetical protein [Arcicella aquatica]MEA5260316.1 hypothetical protein [Arcicella aquatica]